MVLPVLIRGVKATVSHWDYIVKTPWCPCVTRNPRAPVGAGGFFMPQEGESRMIKGIIPHFYFENTAATFC